YPLLAPSVHAWIHEVSGTWDGRPLRICMAAFFAASLGVVLQVLRRRVPERPAWLLTALFGATPAVLTAESGGALSGYVDYPLAIFLLVTVDRLAAWIEAPDPGAAAVAALGVACLSQMKDEGIAIAFLLVLLAPGVGLIHGGPRRAAGAAGLCVGGAALAAAWLLVRQSFLADDNHLGASPGLRIGWLPEVVRLLFSQMLRPKEWTLLWVAILAVLVLRPPSPRRPESLLPWTGIGLLLLYVLVWCAFPGESPKQVMRHGVNRLVLHVLPIFFVWTAGRVHEELQSRARRMPA
ncbi:MAG TPA: hypothetical protein VEJ18_12620, partial [Planctomycetota bacterium]|nr:hypothetical protein [Planctomycetota bacterium]